jgi:hypothetical protein
MVQASAYSSQGFTVSYYDRLPKGGHWLGDLDVSLQNWRHSITAFGGFDTASFELVDNQSVLEDWLQNGLFRPIVARDSYLEIIWEGFVDSITVNQAGLAVTSGPVTTIANRVFAIYSGVDTSVYPPQIGVRKKTPTFNNTTSQADWGIWHEVLSLAGVTDSNADQLVGMYLDEHGHPEMSGNFSFSNQEISLTINCTGWQRTLNYPFNFTTNSGTVSITTRIQQVLNANINTGWISTDYGRIATNATLVPQFEEDDQLALEHLRGLAAMGDENNLRHLFGIYENRQAVYGPVSEQVDYTIELGDPRRQILDSAGAIVPPWKMRPGKWIFFNDFMPGLGSPLLDLHRDPRMLRIESLQFDMRTPYAVQFAGGINSRYEAKSARLGLRGMEV